MRNVRLFSGSRNDSFDRLLAIAKLRELGIFRAIDGTPTQLLSLKALIKMLSEEEK